MTINSIIIFILIQLTFSRTLKLQLSLLLEFIVFLLKSCSLNVYIFTIFVKGDKYITIIITVNIQLREDKLFARLQTSRWDLLFCSSQTESVKCRRDVHWKETLLRKVTQQTTQYRVTNYCCFYYSCHCIQTDQK